MIRSRRALLRGSLSALCVMAGAIDAHHAQVRQALAEAQVELLAEAANDNYGWSVADAGDVDGDGVHDFIVGAIYNDSGAKDAGKAYVYRGGATASSVPFVTMQGSAANEQFAVSVAGAGDLNGDGYADVIVGARLNDINGSASGAAFVYFGGPAMDGVADLVLAGEAADDWFGNSVAGAGDVNGDGFADVVVGAPYNDRAGSAAGAAYIFFGGSSPDATADLILTGEIHDDQFGWSVAGAGDVNADGFADVVVGARLHCVDSVLCPGAAYGRGRAYLYRGGAAMDAVADRVFDGSAANDWFGNTVAGVGDLNGDWFDDIAVGAIYADPVVNNVLLSAAGTVSIYSGGNPMDIVADAVLPGEQPNDQFGWAIARGGDVNGDGRLDVWASAHFFNDLLNSGAGKIEAFSGGRAVSRPPIASAVGEGSNVQLGQSIAGSDVMGMGGKADVLAGQVYSRDVGDGSGKLFVLTPFCLDLSDGLGTMSWTTCYPFGSYDMYRGDIAADLPAGSYGTCLATGVTGASIPQDPENPSPGRGRFYLVAGRLGSLEGALGFDSSGRLRPNTSSCP